MLEAFQRDLQKCAYCPKMCRFACPVSAATHRETHIPQQKMSLLNLYRLEQLAPSESLLAALYHCTGCLLCHTYCLHENQVPAALIEGRALLRKQGVMLPRVRQMELMATQGERALAGDVRATVPKKYITPESPALFLTDRLALRHYQAFLPKLFAVFEAIGVDFIAMRDDWDYAGDIFYYELGAHDHYNALVDANAPKLVGYSQIITDSPSLLYALKTHYSQRIPEIANRSVWLYEFLLDHLRPEHCRSPLKFQRYSFHDSSYAGRYLGLYEAPRQLLQRLGAPAPVELQHSREMADSSGGFVFPLLFQDVATDIARRRWDVFAEGSWDPPGMVVTGWDAYRNFLRLPEAKGQVAHLADLVAQAIL